MIAAREAVETGLDVRTWKQVKIKLLNTGEFDPNYYDELNSYQRYLINEIKKTYRELTK